MIGLAPVTDLWMIAGWLVVLAVWAVWGVWSRPGRHGSMHRHQRAMTALDRASKGDKR